MDDTHKEADASLAEEIQEWLEGEAVDKTSELDLLNALAAQGNLYTREAYDRCPQCGLLNIAVIASSTPYTDCVYCGETSHLKDWTRLCKGIEKPRPRGKHFW